MAFKLSSLLLLFILALMHEIVEIVETAEVI